MKAEKLLARDFVDLMPSGAAWPEGPDPMAGFQRILEASRDVRAKILDLVSDGRRVAIRARYEGGYGPAWLGHFGIDFARFLRWIVQPDLSPLHTRSAPAWLFAIFPKALRVVTQ